MELTGLVPVFVAGTEWRGFHGEGIVTWSTFEGSLSRPPAPTAAVTK
jgi:hypothetical protein